MGEGRGTPKFYGQAFFLGHLGCSDHLSGVFVYWTFANMRVWCRFFPAFFGLRHRENTEHFQTWPLFLAVPKLGLAKLLW